jgi:ribA/ribD-fused uncharacterized protein
MEDTMRETATLYLFWKHQFGQWTLRDIQDVDSQCYNCCEQYMMAKKAQLFGDEDSVQRILAAESPRQQQALGRDIRGFDQGCWDRHKFAIVWFGNYLKFTQHQDLRQRLLATGDKTLAEASPYDLVWGIGYAAEEDTALDPTQWRGQNLLGQALMSVRAALKTQSQLTNDAAAAAAESNG